MNYFLSEWKNQTTFLYIKTSISYRARVYLVVNYRKEIEGASNSFNDNVCLHCGHHRLT